MKNYRRIALLLIFILVFAGCSLAPAPTVTSVPAVMKTPTPNPIFESSDVFESSDSAADLLAMDALPEIVPLGSNIEQLPEGVNVSILVDLTADMHPISPYIYGVSAATADYLQDLRPTMNSWGGNTSTRYNYKLGNAWNTGLDWNYRNANFYEQEGSASNAFIDQAADAGVAVRFALPTLGWVAKDNVSSTCSFPDENGNCTDGDEGNCISNFLQADPNLANVPSDVESVQAFVKEMIDTGRKVNFFAMDNEPGLWGITHYDVHPECTTYDEILQKYLTYASAVREVAPDAELAGPITCCWNLYWNSPAGSIDKIMHDDKDFIPWFLEEVRKHDEANGIKTLDVLDIHYYPESVYNDKTDERTAAVRLRSTRSLWDWTYTDESWISTPIALIPRMQQLIDEYYPGVKFGISEWNFGADESMNGALAVADALGVFGREDLYFASYWLAPVKHSAGYNAFKLYTNYDGQGGRFGDLSVHTESNRNDLVSSYSAFSSETGNLHIMLVNKALEDDQVINIDLGEFVPKESAVMYQVSQSSPSEIIRTDINSLSSDMLISLSPYSITHLVLE